MIRGFIDDENAVSISVGFILTFTISVLMIVMVLSSFYSLMNDAEQTVMHDEFEIHGNDIAVRIATIDTMVGAMTDSGASVEEIQYEFKMPSRIAGKPYSVELDNSSGDIVFISDKRERTQVKVPYFAENTVVSASTVESIKGNFVIAYDPETNIIIIY
jgi:ABC-type multidrug transport system fused ATPase/permease subunit